MTGAPPSALRFVVRGVCASKSNSRRLVPRGRRMASIKSDAATAFLAAFQAQAPRPAAPLTGPVSLHVAIYYPSRRSDLDESMGLDGLQAAGILANDRQVFEVHAFKRKDACHPRVEIAVVPLPGRMPLGQDPDPPPEVEDYLLFAGAPLDGFLGSHRPIASRKENDHE